MWSWLVLIKDYRSDRGHFYGHYSKIQNENGMSEVVLKVTLSPRQRKSACPWMPHPLPISHSPGLQVPSYVTPVSSDDAFGTYELHTPSSIFFSFLSFSVLNLSTLSRCCFFFFFSNFSLTKKNMGKFEECFAHLSLIGRALWNNLTCIPWSYSMENYIGFGFVGKEQTLWLLSLFHNFYVSVFDFS